MCADPVLQQGDMDAVGGGSDEKVGEPPVVVEETPEEERLAEGDSAVVVAPLNAGQERLAEGSSDLLVAEPVTGEGHVSGDETTEPFEAIEAEEN